RRTNRALALRAGGRNAPRHAEAETAITPRLFITQRDVHSGWLQEAWPLQQVSILCWGSPGTLQREIPDGLRQLAR
ncbi:hypothetical protein, partial [Pantoea ananatis]|uniref:hypothetical protein n=3 Tax=Erwiniaceae TaxID=1903409 RepID=UPI0012F68B71